MEDIDFTKYSKIEDIIDDIKTIKVQGATNVALATFEGLKLFVKEYDKKVSYEVLMADIDKAGVSLAFARPNEPLAKNGLKFVTTNLRLRYPGEHDINFAREKVTELCNEYLAIIKGGKQSIIKHSEDIMGNALGVFTHCHSSTAEAVVINQSQKMGVGFKAACTETQPLKQGRITATNLLKAGVDTTFMADSSLESFIIGRDLFTIDVVLIGCDEITAQGHAINKIGSWGAALACYFASKPIYVVTSLLKLDLSTIYRPITVELRDGKELWEDAPKDLKMYNPAFELVDNKLITGFLTEFGLVKPEDVQRFASANYPWLF
jgi:methylthioribose-1-phosphate isomerase